MEGWAAKIFPTWESTKRIATMAQKYSLAFPLGKSLFHSS